MPAALALALPIGLIVAAPIIGGLIHGFERVVRARMQNRIGPSILQPFFDFMKLLDKRPMMLHGTHAFLGLMHFVALWFALAVLLLGGDLLIVIFLHLLSTALLVMAGYSAKSIFSHMGATRQALSTFAYEPILVLVAICFYLVNGTFDTSAIFQMTAAPVAQLPLALVALLIILPIKLKKSPFDVADAHQEIVGGAEIEFSGIFYEALYSARWLEYVFGYSLVYLFAGGVWWLGLIFVVAAFFLMNALDNSTARVNYKQMLKIVYGLALPAVILNIIFLAA